jgi:hypothetical protein
MVEFAIVGPIFFALLFLAFVFAYGAFNQAALDSALQATARNLQVGTPEQTGNPPATTEALLVSNYFCPNSLGVLNCNNIYVRVESIDMTACPGGPGQQDLFDATDGRLPVDGSKALNLSLYGGSAAGGANPGPTTCQLSSSSTGYCVAGPSKTTTNAAPVLVVISAVYLAPSFLGTLLPGAVTYNGNVVSATFSSAALITEGFTSDYGGNSSC